MKMMMTMTMMTLTLTSGAGELHHNHGVPTVLRHDPHSQSCWRGRPNDTQRTGGLCSLKQIVASQPFLGIVCYDVYVISFQVGFTIASGDQSRLFLLQVFVIITSTACLHFCEPLRWPKKNIFFFNDLQFRTRVREVQDCWLEGVWRAGSNSSPPSSWSPSSWSPPPCLPWQTWPSLIPPLLPPPPPLPY